MIIFKKGNKELIEFFIRNFTGKFGFFFKITDSNLRIKTSFRINRFKKGLRIENPKNLELGSNSYCGINFNTIDAIYDNSATKINKYTPGKSLIKIEDSLNFKKNFSDYCILFAWNHKDEIMLKEEQYSRKGGKWIIPVNEINII